MTGLRAVLDGVPDHDRFMGPGEVAGAFAALVDAFPGRARREQVGTSAEGRPIDLVTIGHGGRSVLLVGVPHPNETVGTLTALFLSRLFCEHGALCRSLDATLHVIPVADPDGLALNAGWLDGPPTFARYATHFYRPPHHEQVEWSYPARYETLRFSTPAPETAAVMRVMERVRPEVFYSLHNAGLGGVYFYASDDRPPIFSRWRALAGDLGLPLHRGEPEVPYLEPLAPSVFRMFGVADTYDYFARTLGRDPAPLIGAGTSGDDWMRRVRADAFSLVCEVPYFSAPASGDERPSGRSRREAILEGLDSAEAVAQLVTDAVTGLEGFIPGGRVARSVLAYAEKTPKRLAAERVNVGAAEYEREATVGEVFDAVWGPVFYNALYVGETCRMVADAGDSVAASGLREELERLERLLVAEAGLVALPLRRLVQCQAGAGLIAMGCD